MYYNFDFSILFILQKRRAVHFMRYVYHVLAAERVRARSVHI